jgi:hypothetical protein
MLVNMNHSGYNPPSLGVFDQSVPRISPFPQNRGWSEDSPVFNLSDDSASDSNAALGFQSGFGPSNMFDTHAPNHSRTQVCYL